MKRGEKMKFPFNEVVFDGGAIIELLLSGEDSNFFKSVLNSNIIPLATSLAIIESEYILCRELGKEKAFKKVDNLLDSNYITIRSLELFTRNISTLKCNVSISLADCATIALATINNIPALFARREEELKKPIEEEKFNISIYFLEELFD